MAGAPRKQGLDYFPLSTGYDSIYSAIRQNYKSLGVEIYLELYKNIYGERGYYIAWDEKKAKIFSLENDFQFKKVVLIVTDLLNQGIFDQNLFKTYKILTNLEIQQIFFHAIKRRKEILYDKKYLLLDVEKYLEIEVTENALSVEVQEINIKNGPINADIHVNMNANMNVNNDAYNHVNKTQTKERKGNDSKVEQTIVDKIFFKENAEFENSDSVKNNLESENWDCEKFLKVSEIESGFEKDPVKLVSEQEILPSDSAQSPPLIELDDGRVKPVVGELKKLYPRVLEAYSEFMMHIIGLPMKKLTGRDGNATKEIIDYLQKIDPEDNGVMNIWIDVLSRWRELEPYFQKQFKLYQVNYNFERILNDLGISVNKNLICQIHGREHKKNGAKPIYREVRQAFESYRRHG